MEKNILNLMVQKKDHSRFLQAIEDAKADLSMVHRHESVVYLEEVEKNLK